MIERAEFDEIVAVYSRHGWILRRVLVTAETTGRLNLSENRLSEDVVIEDADIDAAWFSRPPKAGGVAWEIRHLSSVPFALLEKIDEYGEGFRGELAVAEERLRAAIASTKRLDKVIATPSN